MMDLTNAHAAATARHAGLSLTPGQKVLDGVTGFTGVVEGGVALRPDVLEQYAVRLTNGEAVTRSLKQLIILPPGVSHDLEDFT